MFADSTCVMSFLPAPLSVSFSLALAQAFRLPLGPLHQLPDACPHPYRRLCHFSARKPLEVSPCRIAPKVLLVTLCSRTPVIWPSVPFLALSPPSTPIPQSTCKHQASWSAQPSAVVVYTAIP